MLACHSSDRGRPEFNSPSESSTSKVQVLLVSGREVCVFGSDWCGVTVVRMGAGGIQDNTRRPILDHWIAWIACPRRTGATVLESGGNPLTSSWQPADVRLCAVEVWKDGHCGSWNVEWNGSRCRRVVCRSACTQQSATRFRSDLDRVRQLLASLSPGAFWASTLCARHARVAQPMYPVSQSHLLQMSDVIPPISDVGHQHSISAPPSRTWLLHGAVWAERTNTVTIAGGICTAHVQLIPRKVSCSRRGATRGRRGANTVSVGFVVERWT